jgi:hypothetical protein
MLINEVATRAYVDHRLDEVLRKIAHPDPFALFPDEWPRPLVKHVFRLKSIKTVENWEKRGLIARIPNRAGVFYPKKQLVELYYKKGLDRK